MVRFWAEVVGCRSWGGACRIGPTLPKSKDIPQIKLTYRGCTLRFASSRAHGIRNANTVFNARPAFVAVQQPMAVVASIDVAMSPPSSTIRADAPNLRTTQM